MAYYDVGNGNKATVKKFDGSNWSDVGIAGFSTSVANYLSMDLDVSGMPVVIYQDAGNGNKATVKKFDGSTWVDVGAPGISPGTATYTSIAIDGSGTMYISYIDGANSNNAVVKKFDGSTWIDVGTPVAGYTRSLLDIDGNGIPYVIYHNSGYNLTVKKFDGSNWVNVGTLAVSDAPYGFNSFAFGANNVPIISYWYGGLFARSFGSLVVLPLRLTEFNGRINNNNTLLTWKTDNEINTREFIVERSTDGRSYSTVGTVPAANTQGVHQYSFTDRDIHLSGATLLYYRLKQKDIDGKSTYSRVILLPVNKTGNRVVCYPNPVNSEAILTITLDQAAKVQARLIDHMGKVLQTQQWNLSAGSTSLSIDMSQLAKGMYYLDIRGGSINKQIGLIKH